MEPLTPAVFHILLALADGENHGYGIMREVAESTNQQFVMGPGTLYGTLNRMLQGQLIEECGERADPSLSDERRRYYRSTKKGLEAAVSETHRLQALLRIARSKSLLKRPRTA
jgi:DNA-binding PadR family transcriptional regulator